LKAQVSAGRAPNVMHLKKLEIIGFKSFCEKISITFPKGVSAIVGPNGCGKSNVVDALRWVMGEQSVKQLRGKAMEDVIFAGANGRPPLNLAEVSLTLSNDNGSGPEAFKHFSEIMLTRRLFRSGESAYLINKIPSRLKDIHDVLLGSGMGARSYAVIQQGNIGAITEAGPDERRAFLEEAAGVTRYKTRKLEALRKLELTSQNLLRVKDIIAEVERQMSGVQRQARKAERYTEYQAQIRILDLRLSAHQHDQYARDIQKCTHLIKELNDTDMSHVAQIKKLDAAMEDIKLKRMQQDRSISEKRTILISHQRQIERMESDANHNKKDGVRLEQEVAGLAATHADLVARNQKIVEEIGVHEARVAQMTTRLQSCEADLAATETEEQRFRKTLEPLNTALTLEKARLTENVGQEARYRNMIESAANNTEHLKRRLRLLDEEVHQADKKRAELVRKEHESAEFLTQIRRRVADLETRILAYRERLSILNQQFGDQIRKVRSLESERAQHKSQHDALKKMAASYAWYRDGVKAVMNRYGEIDGVFGVVADILEAEPAHEAAVEAALGETLQYLVVTNIAAGMSALNYLRDAGAGRCGFIPRDSVNPSSKEENAPEGKDRLIDHDRARPGFEDMVQTMLGSLRVVPDLESGWACRKNALYETGFVTPDGAVITQQGMMIGGSQDRLFGILEKKRTLKKLAADLEVLEKRMGEARETQKDLEEQVRSGESALQEMASEKLRAAEAEADAQKQAMTASENLKHALRSLEMLRMEQDDLGGRADEATEQAAGYQSLLDRIRTDVGSSQQQVASLSEKIDSLSSELKVYEKKSMNLKVDRAAARAELESETQSLRRLREFQQEGFSRIGQLVQDMAEKTRKKDDLVAKIHSEEATLKEMHAKVQEMETRLRENETAHQELDDLIRAHDESIGQIKEQRESVLQRMRLIEVERSQAQLKMENVVSRVRERYHHALSALRSELSGRPDGADMAPDRLEEELTQLRDKVSRLGPVNLSAISEYQALKERYDFLDAQRADLEKAVADLQQVIRKINQISQERFLATFQQVNDKMAEVFPRLFQGGEGKLVLTEPGNPLETGVEFMVHPPGKKLTRLSLLSGGEKALSAIAFVFSIFLIRPASFCILDEIDAPLDEANVGRFNELLKIIGEKSQIIMITHKKKSMEFADTLFGITMEDKGVSKVVSVNIHAQAADGPEQADAV